MSEIHFTPDFEYSNIEEREVKQLVILDCEERAVFLDAGSIEECEDGIIVRLKADCVKENYSLKYCDKPTDGKKSIVSACVEDGKLHFMFDDWLSEEII